MALLTQRQATATRAVLVGVAAVGVDIRGDLLGELGQIVGPMCGGQLGQMGFGDGTGSDVDGAGQLVQELPDHAHVARANVSGALGGGRAGQQRRQRFTGQRAPWAQLGGFGDAPTGFPGRDVQPVGQRVGKSRAQLLAARLLGELVDQRVAQAPAAVAPSSPVAPRGSAAPDWSMRQTTTHQRGPRRYRARRERHPSHRDHPQTRTAPLLECSQ